MNRASSDAYALLRIDVHGRENGCCVRCLTYAAVVDGECHHRLLLSRGGRDTAWNCIWLCRTCHRWVHAHPAEATPVGLLVPSGVDPASWPVRRRSGWMRPTPGSWVRCAPNERQVA